MVVVRVVADVAQDVGLLEAADAVLQPGRAGHGPRSGQRRLIPQVRIEALALGAVRDGDRWHVGDVRDVPRLGAAREEGVRHVHDRGHVLERDPPRLDREREALGGSRGRHDGDRRVGVPPEHDLEQIGLLGLGRHAGRRTGALDVDDDERQLDHDREPEGFLLERDARTGRRGHPHRAAVARADGGADGGDLVLCLERLDPEVLVARELVEDVRGGRDRVGAVEDVATGELGRGHESQRRRLVAGDVPVVAGRELGGRDDVALVEDLGRLAEVVARVQGSLVALGDLRALRELVVDPGDRRCPVALVQPEHEAEREEVLGQVDLLVRQPEALERPAVECRDRDAEHVPLRERAVDQRVGGIAHLRQVLGRERVLVDDQRAARG